jgi:hypothetical protein
MFFASVYKFRVSKQGIILGCNANGGGILCLFSLPRTVSGASACCADAVVMAKCS